MKKRKQSAMQMEMVAPVLGEESAADEGAMMARLRGLGLDLVAARQGEMVEAGQEEVMLRMSGHLEQWVRTHLDGRAEREGGLTQDNVTGVLASTTLRKKA